MHRGLLKGPLSFSLHIVKWRMQRLLIQPLLVRQGRREPGTPCCL